MNKQVNVKFSVYIMVALEYILKGVFAGEIAFGLYYLLPSLYVQNIDFWGGFCFLAIGAFFACARHSAIDVWKRRTDLFLYIITGVWLTFVTNGWGLIRALDYLAIKDWQILVALLFIPAIAVIYKIKSYSEILGKKTQKYSKQKYYHDSAIMSAKDDLLSMQEDAVSFAKEIEESGDDHGLVWGIEAPWGTGKTSFLNLCKNELENRGIRVFTFEPLRYSGSNGLREALIEKITNCLCEAIDSPELDIILGRYASVLKQVSFEFSGINIKARARDLDEEKEFQQISSFMEQFDKPIVLVIDDLDRLNPEEIKQVLCVVKAAYDLPHVSYVLCYDMDILCNEKNLCKEASQNVEFMKKFIQVRWSLFPERNQLVNAIEQIKLKEIQSLYSLDDKKYITDSLERMIDVIKKVMQQRDAKNYCTFIGDMRCLYRLINLVTLLKIQKIDFSNYDFKEEHLLDLLLLYQNYPSIFREIYIAETWNASNVFTAEYSYTDKNYVHTPQYKDKIQEINEKYQDAVFLVENLFDIKDLKQYEDKSKKVLSTIHKEELLEYLNLIVHGQLRSKYEQMHYYIRLLTRFCYNDPDFSLHRALQELDNNEAWYKKFFVVAAYDNTLVFDNDKMEKVIQYLVENRPMYAYKGFSSNSKLQGGREDLLYLAVLLLGKYGLDAGKKYSDYPYSEMGEFFFKKLCLKIFGDSSEVGSKVLDLYDLLTLRLECCAERMGKGLNDPKFQHVIEFIGKYKNDQFDLVGDIGRCTIEEMRYFSQVCYQKFKEMYIDTNQSFWDEIDDLTIQAVQGSFGRYLSDTDAANKLDFFKTEVKEFIMYQMGSKEHVPNMGVPCGFYNEAGNDNDKGEISDVFNRYVFKVVFKEAEIFNELLFMMLENQRRMRAIISLEGLCTYVDRHCLLEWWGKHGEEVKRANVEKSFTTVYQGKAITSQEGLMRYYGLLDSAVNDEPSQYLAKEM